MKRFVAGFLCCAVLMSSMAVFAESVTKNIDAIFGQVKLVVNGNAVDKETLLYDGTTYVPLRAAAEALGMEVGWDGSTNTASLTSKTAEKAPTPTTPPEPAPKATETPSLKAASTPTVSLRNSSDVSKYITDNYKQFTFTTKKTDGLDTIASNWIVKIESASVNWSSPNEIESIWIKCDSELRRLNNMMGQDKDAGRLAANNYMKQIANDLMNVLPNVDIGKCFFTYSWYTYPNIREGLNTIYMSQWRAQDGQFKWSISEESFMEKQQ